MDRFTWQSALSVAEAASLGKCTVAEAMLEDSPFADRVVLKAGGIDRRWCTYNISHWNRAGLYICDLE